MLTYWYRQGTARYDVEEGHAAPQGKRRLSYPNDKAIQLETERPVGRETRDKMM